MMIALRKAHPVLRRRTFFNGERGGMPPEIIWHGIEPAKPDFSYDSRSLALALDGRRSDRPERGRPRHLRRHERLDAKPLGFTDPGRPVGPPLAASGRHGASLARRHRRRKAQAHACPCCQMLSRAGPLDCSSCVSDSVTVRQTCRDASRDRAIIGQSSPTRTRTLNLAVNSRSLYRLSYRGIRPSSIPAWLMLAQGHSS